MFDNEFHNAQRAQELLVSLCRRRADSPAGIAPSSMIFFCASPPPISLPDYASRFAGHLLCSPSVFVVAAAILDRLYTALPQVFIMSCAHKLFLGAHFVAVKFTDDTIYPAHYYAAVGGVPLQTLLQIEQEIARVLGFRFFVSHNDYDTTCTLLSSVQAPPSPPKPVVRATDEPNLDVSFHHDSEAAVLCHQDSHTHYRSIQVDPSRIVRSSNKHGINSTSSSPKRRRTGKPVAESEMSPPPLTSLPIPLPCCFAPVIACISPPVDQPEDLLL